MTRIHTIALAAAVLGVVSSVAQAQQDEADLRKKFTITVPSSETANVEQNAQLFRGAPGTNTGSPIAFGPNWRDVYVGVGYQAQTRGFYNPTTNRTSASGGDDGSVAVGFGLGNATDAVGLEVDVASLSAISLGFGSLTAFSFKVDRMLDQYSAIAVGVENAIVSGTGAADGKNSWYAVASRVFVLDENGPFRAFTGSFGIGNGRFRFISDVANNRSTVNAFASGSLLITDRISALADYTGQDLDIGISFVPLKAFPIVLTPALADVTGSASKTMRFTLGAGVGMHF